MADLDKRFKDPENIKKKEKLLLYEKIDIIRQNQSGITAKLDEINKKLDRIISGGVKKKPFNERSIHLS